jgi:hypothetical protein
LTAASITNWLMRTRWRQAFVLPNYTPARWWECDVFEVTKAGYFREYEIKVSRADFFADAGKDKRDYHTEGEWWKNRKPGEIIGPLIRNKHERLAAADPCGPVSFWYVVPDGLLKAEELPPWAGLIYLVPGRHRIPDERVVREAPRLHRQKLDEQILVAAKAVCYWRFHRLRVKTRPTPTAAPEGDR